MKRFFSFFTDTWHSRYLLWQLTKRDVTQQYKKSKLGMFWSLAEPLAFMGILYLVFGIGLRGGRSMDFPFLCYLVSGMAVVQFFTGTMNQGTNAVRSHSYLLKKINFRLSILPISTVLTGIINHLIFMVAAFVIFLTYKIYPNWFWFQVLYYMFALSVFLLGISWFTSSVGVFMPDLQHIVSIFGRMIFYLTPVFWSFDMVGPRLQYWLKFNPLFYIAMGYRESIYYGIPFWNHPLQTAYFWGWVLFMIIVGVFTFRKLRPQFADYI